MTYSYTLHPEAQKEYEDSVEWYLEKSIKVASKFVNSVDNALKLICSNPFIWPNKYSNYHEYHLKRFPFTVVYCIETSRNLVVIIAIYHQKRTFEKKYR